MRPGLGDGGFGFGEPELDANTALTELDKGLRSTKLGEQVEAIVRFPALFERYPFPILINSAFLKLADVFHHGSNFLRLWILRVCQQSERHLDKVLNVDEFIRRIFSVIHSNDPIARALTLRTLGSLSGLIPERKPVHHSIRVGLDSHDRVEVSAAIYAASCFAKRSKTFGTTMCMKIASMAQRLSTPIDLKLKLIPIFQHMHHEVNTASMVRKLCQELLNSYPSEEFVTTILHTLTQLAAATISNLTEQVSFLLEHLEDSRKRVKLSVLKDLKFLGKKGGHLWESSHVSSLVNSILKPDSEDKMETDEPCAIKSEITYTTLDVINSVTSSAAILPFIYSTDSPLWKLLETSIYSTDMSIALKAIEIATYIAINWKDNNLSGSGSNLVHMAFDGAESLLTSLCKLKVEDLDEKIKNEVVKDLETCLSYGALLCKADASKCDRYCELLIKLFKTAETSARNRNLLSQSLGAIGSRNQDAVIKILPDVLAILQKMSKKTIEAENSTVATLVGVVFQAHQGYNLSSKATSIVISLLNASNLWLAYRLARNSLRYGQPETAVVSLDGMPAKVSSENFHFWLSSILYVAKAEEILTLQEKTPRLISRLSQASNLYLKSVASLKAASSPMMSLQFQIEYIRLRSEMLVAFSNLLISCNTLQLSPAPLIAVTIASSMRDELLKSGRVVTQLRKSIREFQSISEMYARLYQTAFDADNDSLLNLQILQQMCRLVARSIEKLVVSKDHPSFSADDHAVTFFTEMSYEASGNSWSMILSCRKAMEVFHKIKSLPTQTISVHHVNCIREASQILVETPVSYPRFFFQTLQMTRAKIAVSPQPRQPGESVTVMHGNNLALKVEGVIQQSATAASGDSQVPAIFRKPKAIKITVVSAPLPNPRSHLMEHAKLPLEPVTLVKEVIPHRDFFQAQFLLVVASGGLTNVTVDTSLVDFEGRQWMTGPRTTLSVRVFDDPGTSSKQNVPQTVPGPSRQISSGIMPPAVNPAVPPARF